MQPQIREHQGYLGWAKSPLHSLSQLYSRFSFSGLNIRGHAEVIDVSPSLWQDSPDVFLASSLLFMIPCWILQSDRTGSVGRVPESWLNGLFCCIQRGNDKAKISSALPVIWVAPNSCGVTRFSGSPVWRASDLKWEPVQSTQIFKEVQYSFLMMLIPLLVSQETCIYVYFIWIYLNTSEG